LGGKKPTTDTTQMTQGDQGRVNHTQNVNRKVDV